MNTAQTINFDIPLEEVDIPMEPDEKIEEWSGVNKKERIKKGTQNKL